MHRPLWQILLTLFVVAFTLHRALMAYLFASVMGDVDSSGALAAAHGLQALAGALTALGLWLGRRWVLGAVVALGVLVAAVGLFQTWLGILPPLAAVSQVLVAALSAGALFLILRHEFRAGGPSSAA